MRKPIQGVWNIVRFNWHFYAFAVSGLMVVLILAGYINETAVFYAYTLCVLVVLSIVISLLVSYYIYDVSNMYEFIWMDGLGITGESKIVNIHAGFDETSCILKNKFPYSELVVLDFYNPAKHREVSVKRARKAYPPFAGTQPAIPENLQLANNFC